MSEVDDFFANNSAFSIRNQLTKLRYEKFFEFLLVYDFTSFYGSRHLLFQTFFEISCRIEKVCDEQTTYLPSKY